MAILKFNGLLSPPRTLATRGGGIERAWMILWNFTDGEKGTGNNFWAFFEHRIMFLEHLLPWVDKLLQTNLPTSVYICVSHNPLYSFFLLTRAHTNTYTHTHTHTHTRARNVTVTATPKKPSGEPRAWRATDVSKENQRKKSRMEHKRATDLCDSGAGLREAALHVLQFDAARLDAPLDLRLLPAQLAQLLPHLLHLVLLRLKDMDMWHWWHCEMKLWNCLETPAVSPTRFLERISKRRSVPNSTKELNKNTVIKEKLNDTAPFSGVLHCVFQAKLWVQYSRAFVTHALPKLTFLTDRYFSLRPHPTQIVVPLGG